MLTLFLVAWTFAAILLTYRAVKERRNADDLVVRGVKNKGLVIGHQFRLIKGSYRETDYPIIRFTTATGQVVEVAKMTQLPLLNKLETIPIFYEVTNPQNIVFESEPGSALPYLFPIAMWLITIIVLLFSILGK